jgi:hypothetical protein
VLHRKLNDINFIFEISRNYSSNKEKLINQQILKFVYSHTSNFSAIRRLSPLGHTCFFFFVKAISNVFICFASFENRKTYQPARENKQAKITKIQFMQIIQNCV